MHRRGPLSRSERICRIALDARCATRSVAAGSCVLVARSRCLARGCAQSLPLDRIKLPPGFAIELVARVPNARAMTWGSDGTLFVGIDERRQRLCGDAARGRRAAPPCAYDRLGTARARGRRVSQRRALRVGGRAASCASTTSSAGSTIRPRRSSSATSFPSDGHHGRKFIAFGPDGKLYVPVGAPCNVCEPDPDRYANIMRMNADGSGLEIFARGVRNTVGFDWHPRTKELWFTDNGRDMLGDESPPDELNRAPQRRPALRLPVLPRRHDRAIRSSGAGARAASSCRRRRSSARTWPRSACASTPAPVPGRVPRPDLHRRARLVEPQRARSATA